MTRQTNRTPDSKKWLRQNTRWAKWLKNKGFGLRAYWNRTRNYCFRGRNRGRK